MQVPTSWNCFSKNIFRGLMMQTFSSKILMEKNMNMIMVQAVGVVSVRSAMAWMQSLHAVGDTTHGECQHVPRKSSRQTKAGHAAYLPGALMARPWDAGAVRGSVMDVSRILWDQQPES